MYKPFNYFSNITGYSTSQLVNRGYALATSKKGLFDYTGMQPGFNIPYFVFNVKLSTGSMGELYKSQVNGKWQTVDLSFMAGKVTEAADVVSMINKSLILVEAEYDNKSGIISLIPKKLTFNPDEEAGVDFLLAFGSTKSFDILRSNPLKYSIYTSSYFPTTRLIEPSGSVGNIILSGFGLSPQISEGIVCPNLYPKEGNPTDGTFGYISCCDGYTPTTVHQSGIWDFSGLTAPLLYIRMLNRDTVYSYDAQKNEIKPVVFGQLIVKIQNRKYTTQELADTINNALFEISPCGQPTPPCSAANGTIPFIAKVSPAGRLMICQSFYELAINGSCSYIDNIFSFDRMVTDKTCKVKYGYTLTNIPSGCASSGFIGGKQDVDIINDLAYVEQVLKNGQFNTFDFTPAPVLENVLQIVSQGKSYGTAPTMIGPITNSPFAYSNQITSIPSNYWTSNLFVQNSQFAEFWASFDISEDAILQSMKKKARILKILSVSASVRASWDYFGYFSSAYITYPFYNWALVLNTSSQYALKPNKNSSTIYFSNNGISGEQAGQDFTTPILPSWDGNYDSLQYIRAFNKSCSTDPTVIKDIEIPKFYGRYRMGVVFDWRLWARTNPNGVNSTDFSGAFAVPSITLKVAYI